MAEHNEWEGTIFSVLILVENVSLIGLSNTIMVAFFLLSGINLSISLPLNPAIYRTSKVPKILFTRSKEQNESPPFPHFTF